MASSPQRNLSSFNEQEYTARKMAQLRNQYPEKSEAQISRMAKESAKKELQRLQQTNQPTTNQRNQNFTNRKKSSGSKKNPSEPNDPKKKLEFGEEKKIEVSVPKQNKKKPQPNPESNKKEEQLPGEQSSTGSPGQKKTKKIKKDSKLPRSKLLEEYQHFCRYYRHELKSQHPNWTSHQIMTIIKLLWRKKKISGKKLAVHLMRDRRNPLTGRKFFGDMKRKEEKMPGYEIQERWYILPRETRKYQERLGNGRGQEGFTCPLQNMPKTIKFGHLTEAEPVSFKNNLLSFINNN